MKFSDLFENLEGVWSLKRKISDGHHFEGEARFSFMAAKQYCLNESGVLILPGGERISASRQWVWQLIDTAQLHISYFEKPPRLYHELTLLDERAGGWTGRANHLCGADTYSGTYKFFEDRFVIIQDISGPTKDYSVESIYSA